MYEDKSKQKLNGQIEETDDDLGQVLADLRELHRSSADAASVHGNMIRFPESLETGSLRLEIESSEDNHVISLVTNSGDIDSLSLFSIRLPKEDEFENAPNELRLKFRALQDEDPSTISRAFLEEIDRLYSQASDDGKCQVCFAPTGTSYFVSIDTVKTLMEMDTKNAGPETIESSQVPWGRYKNTTEHAQEIVQALGNPSQVVTFGADMLGLGTMNDILSSSRVTSFLLELPEALNDSGVPVEQGSDPDISVITVDGEKATITRVAGDEVIFSVAGASGLDDEAQQQRYERIAQVLSERCEALSDTYVAQRASEVGETVQEVADEIKAHAAGKQTYKLVYNILSSVDPSTITSADDLHEVVVDGLHESLGLDVAKDELLEQFKAQALESTHELVNCIGLTAYKEERPFFNKLVPDLFEAGNVDSLSLRGAQFSLVQTVLSMDVIRSKVDGIVSVQRPGSMGMAYIAQEACDFVAGYEQLSDGLQEHVSKLKKDPTTVRCYKAVEHARPQSDQGSSAEVQEESHYNKLLNQCLANNNGLSDSLRRAGCAEDDQGPHGGYQNYRAYLQSMTEAGSGLENIPSMLGYLQGVVDECSRAEIPGVPGVMRAAMVDDERKLMEYFPSVATGVTDHYVDRLVVEIGEFGCFNDVSPELGNAALALLGASIRQRVGPEYMGTFMDRGGRLAVLVHPQNESSREGLEAEFEQVKQDLQDLLKATSEAYPQIDSSRKLKGGYGASQRAANALKHSEDSFKKLDTWYASEMDTITEDDGSLSEEAQARFSPDSKLTLSNAPADVGKVLYVDQTVSYVTKRIQFWTDLGSVLGIFKKSDG